MTGAQRTVRTMAALIAAALLWPVPVAQAQQRIAAVVNEDVISVRDLGQRILLVIITSGLQSDEATQRELAPQVLRGLIDEKLQTQEARRLAVEVSDQEIADAIGTIADRNNISSEQLFDILEDGGVADKTLVEQIRAQVGWFKVVGREVRPRVIVTEEQIDLALREFVRGQGRPELLISEILLPVYNPEDEETVNRDAFNLIEDVQAGANFAALASQVSVATSAEQGGDLGWVRESRIPDEFRPILDAMGEGEISAPIRSPAGFHILMVNGRRIAPSEEAASSRVLLSQFYFPLSAEGANADRGALRAQATELRDQLTSCVAINELAEELGDPGSGDLGWMAIGDLPPELGQPVAGLEVASLSAPLDGPGGVHLIMVCEREGDAATEERRDEIAADLENEQIERLARRLLRNLRISAFIDVRI